MTSDDTIELGELLTLLGDWLEGTDQPQLAASFARFIGTDAYDLHDLRTDLARFAFLLGTDDGSRLFGPHQHP
jgi:IS5 family transposase